jgi:hypothetical protein
MARQLAEGDEQSLKALAEDVGELDHLVSPASDQGDRANYGFFRRTAGSIPARRVGSSANISAAARQAMTNPFVTGTIFMSTEVPVWAEVDRK